MNLVVVGQWIVRGLQLVPAILQAIVAVERLKQGDTSQAKRQAAIELAKISLTIAEGVTARDLFDDDRVEAAMGKAIDAIVGLQNAIRDVARELEAGRR